ncbi:MAG: nitroreductase family protein [Clostridia bacterium]|jgi:nitroreductase
MEFNELVNKRRTAREFTNKEVSKKQIEEVLHSASLAPSAKNRQPWKFYILNNEQKNHIMNMLVEWEKSNRNEKTSVKGSAEQIRMANKMIMIYSDNYQSNSKSKNYKKPDYISIRMCYRKYEFASYKFRTWKLYFM